MRVFPANPKQDLKKRANEKIIGPLYNPKKGKV